MLQECYSPRQFVKRYAIEQVVCTFSGGKDSLVATHYTLESLRRVDIPKWVVWVDTTVMIPGVREFVIEVSKKLGWNLQILSPKRTFEDFVLYGYGNGSRGWGMPTIKRRWCCFALKLEPIARFCSELRGRVACVTGLRREESIRRRDYQQVYFTAREDKRLGLKRTEVWNYSPIIHWTGEQVERYIEVHNLPKPPWYEKGIKETCCCGCYSTLRELIAVAKNYPEFFERFLHLEAKFRSGGCCFYLQGKPLSAWDIWLESLKNNYPKDRDGGEENTL
jgi:phosphoadenosine phosphosulfate reductase